MKNEPVAVLSNQFVSVFGQSSLRCLGYSGRIRCYFFSNGKMTFQSFFMSTTVHPFA
jgi:hypothetical protein